MPEEWDVVFFDDAVEDEFKDLPKDAQTKISWIINLIRANGLEELHEPYIKHLQGKLWEIRGKSGRAIYITITGRLVVILRCFLKKTNQTPPAELELAFKRMGEVEDDEEE